MKGRIERGYGAIVESYKKFEKTMTSREEETKITEPENESKKKRRERARERRKWNVEVLILEREKRKEERREEIQREREKARERARRQRKRKREREKQQHEQRERKIFQKKIEKKDRETICFCADRSGGVQKVQAHTKGEKECEKNSVGKQRMCVLSHFLPLLSFI